MKPEKDTGNQWRAAACKGAVLVLAFLFAAFSAAAQAKFGATLDRNTIAMGESATLTLNIEGGKLQSQPTVPRVPGLDYDNMSQSQVMIYGGAAITMRTTITLEVHPSHEGDYTIPAITALIDDKNMTSQPLRLKVTRSTLGALPGQLEPAFVQLSTPTNTIFIAQIVPVEIKCYCLAAERVQAPQLTSDSFTVGNMPDFRGNAPQVNVQGRAYNLLTFRVPVSPTKTGPLTLGPANWSLTLLSGPRDIFGNFRDHRAVTIDSDSIQFHVLPIPTNNAPASFNGAIGDFSLAQYEASPTKVAVGDPITLKIRIAGRGSFDTVALSADQLGWHEFNTYPPTTKFDSSDPMQIDGSKYFEQVIIPQNAGIKEIPAFNFSFFDPQTRAFRRLTHQPIPLSVQPTAATPQPTVVSAPSQSSDAQPPAQEIVHIKEHLGSLAMTETPLIQRPAFLALQAIAPLAWICALLWRRQKDKLANDARLRRRIEVARYVQQGLGELSKHASANNAAEFYAAVFRLLQEQLGERLDLPASGITEAVLDEAQARGVSLPSESLLRELFHACNQYRYASSGSGNDLSALIPKVKSALQDLQKMPVSISNESGKRALQTALPLLILAAAVTARAQSASGDFDQANKLYDEGHYPEAARAYEKMLQDGQVSSVVYFNLGNAWFKAGQIGRAIFAFRRAEELAPRDPDIRANLQFARNQSGVGTPAIPGSPWTRWIERLTINEWTALAGWFVSIFFILLMARQIWPALKKSGSGWAVAFALASVWCILCVALAWNARYSEPSSVVIVPEAVARSGPLDEAQSVFTAHDGAELLVLDRKDGWLQVADAARHTGWLPEKELDLLP